MVHSNFTTSTDIVRRFIKHDAPTGESERLVTRDETVWKPLFYSEPKTGERIGYKVGNQIKIKN